MTMKEIEIKGQAIRTTLLAIGELFGERIESEVVSAVTADFQSALRTGSILSSGWYPIAWYRQFHDQLKRLLPHDTGIARRISRLTTQKDISGIYQFILMLSSPELLARHFDKVVDSYFRGGEVAVNIGTRRFQIDAQGWHGITPEVVEECVEACVVILEHTGAKAIRSSFREVGPGRYRLEFAWM
jgi:hypothetical protein